MPAQSSAKSKPASEIAIPDTLLGNATARTNLKLRVALQTARLRRARFYAGLLGCFTASGLGISKTAGSIVLFNSILFTVMLKENWPPKSRSME